MNTETGAEQDTAARTRSPGEILREERELRALSVQQVADELNLTMHFIRALEADQYEKLPGDVFARGYLRSYAALLQLDPESLSRSFNEYVYARESKQRVTRERRTARRRKDKNRPWIVISGIAFIVVAIALWYFSSDAGSDASDSLAETSDTVPVTESVSVPLSPQGTVVPAPRFQEQALAESSDQRLIEVGASGEDLLRLELSAESWVAVDDGEGQQLFRDMLDSGDVLQVRGSGPFDLLLGDSAAARLYFNGEPVDMGESVRADNSARLSLGM